VKVIPYLVGIVQKQYVLFIGTCVKSVHQIQKIFPKRNYV